MSAARAVVPQPRAQQQPAAVRGPAGAVTVPIGQPVRSAEPAPRGTLDPGFRRAPAGLNDRLYVLWRAFPGKTGIAVQRIDGEWALSQRGDDLFPQQSVSKLWVALTVLDAVDQGRIRMDQQVRIGREDLTLFHQPIAARVQSEGSVTMSVRDLIETAITHSDNTANDSLLRTVGGPSAVRAFVSKNDLGVDPLRPRRAAAASGTAASAGSKAIRSGAISRPRAPRFRPRRAAPRWTITSPIRWTARALGDCERADTAGAGTLLSPKSTDYLLGVMSRTKSGPKRLKAGLPAGWQFLHKTGTGQDLNGMTAGYNDIGIATAPDGTRYAIVVMLGSTTSSVPARMALMQAVSGAVAEFHRKVGI